MDGTGIESQTWGDELPSRTLGRYELLGALGTGGMATVSLARTAGEAGFQRLFAIKVLHPHLSSESGFVEMFLDEARIAARLHHPNIVPIVDLGLDHGVHFVAMEYVEGCSLSALLRKHADRRPPRLLVAIMLDALAGLDAAHSLKDDAGQSMNLVHRDVSPQNVLVGVDGAARITDFGIARAESRIGGTRPGQLKGKIAYMSPEQIRGDAIDRRSDVFSAGAMLWSMLTGRRLFSGENDAATMNAILHVEIPAPSTIGLHPPAELDAVCMRALERDPDKRFATAGEMEEALREAATALGALGSRREVSAWVNDTFARDLAARRAAIRAAASRAPGSPQLTPMAFRATTEFPSFTPSAMTGAAPDEFAEISVTPVPERTLAADELKAPRRRWPIVAGILAACAVALGASLVMRGSDDEHPIVAAPAETAGTELSSATTSDEGGRGDTTPEREATTYLDETEKLLASGRVDAAREMIALARELELQDPDVKMRLARLAGDPRLNAAAPAPVAPVAVAAVASRSETDRETRTRHDRNKRAPAAGKRPSGSAPDPAVPPVPAKPRVAAVAVSPAAPAPAPVVTPPSHAATSAQPSAPGPVPTASPPAPASPARSAPSVAPPAAPTASTAIAAPRLPPAYSARSMKELAKVLGVIEGEAISRGNAPATIRGVTDGIAEEAFGAFAPGQLIELHPRSIYYAIVRAARTGQSPAAMRASLRTAFQRGQL